MGTLEQIIAILFAAGLLYFLLPGIKQSLKEGKEAKDKDWLEFAKIMAIVVIFVVMLVLLAS